MHSVLFAIVVAAFWLSYTCFNSFSTRRKRAQLAAANGCSEPPSVKERGPLGLKIILGLKKANQEGRGPTWFKNTFDQLGENVHTMKCDVLGDELIVTRDPENAKAIFGIQSHDFLITIPRREIWTKLIGPGIFTTEAGAWKHSRSLVRPQFSREQVADLELEEVHVQALLGLDTLRAGSDGWTKQVDLSPLFHNFTLDVVTEFLYGHSINSQTKQHSNPTKGENTSPLDDFSYHLESSKSCIYSKAILGRWHNLLPSPSFTHHCEQIHRLVDGFVGEALQRGTDDTTQKRTFLSELIKSSQNRYELRSETLNILNAGRDTTAALLGWTFYHLSRDQRVFNKLRQSIIAEFGPSSKGEITFANLRSNQYLQHVLNEVLRIAAVVPINERVSVSDTTLPRGGGPDGLEPIVVPAGVRVLIPMYAMQHRADLWGDDVDDFIPERWENHRPGWEFMPFGGGRRKCIGQQFALTEASYVVIRFLQRFDCMTSIGPDETPLYYVPIVNRSMTGVQVRMHEAAQ